MNKEYIECPQCNGHGSIITCWDDICVGLGHCIHGDGEEVCALCGGEGCLYTGPDIHEMSV